MSECGLSCATYTSSTCSATSSSVCVRAALKTSLCLVSKNSDSPGVQRDGQRVPIPLIIDVSSFLCLHHTLLSDCYSVSLAEGLTNCCQFPMPARISDTLRSASIRCRSSLHGDTLSASSSSYASMAFTYTVALPSYSSRDFGGVRGSAST